MSKFLTAISFILTLALGLLPASSSAALFCRNPHVEAPAEFRPNRLGKALDRLALQAANPYTLAHDVRDDLPALAKILSAQQPSLLDSWVKSPAHAVFLFDLFLEAGLSNHTEALESLLINNRWFQEAMSVRGMPNGGLITWAFEKEGTNQAITLWYKDAHRTDEAWFGLPEHERTSMIRQLAWANRKESDVSVVAPTEFKPSNLGGYSEEIMGVHKTRIWEVRTKRFEISLKRLMSQIREVTTMFKETHSLHAHLVFEMALDYVHFSKFTGWVKQLNDFAYLRGMEEGLHGNQMAGIAELPGVAHRTLPLRLLDILKSSHKFFSIGVRGEIYGSASDRSRKKVGLEFRDVTRNMSVLESILKRTASTVATFGWEKLNILESKFRQQQRFLTGGKESATTRLREVLTPEWAEFFSNTESMSATPLIDFENGLYANFQTGTFEKPSLEVQKRILTARKSYVQSLHAIIKEVGEIEGKGQTATAEEVRMAMQWNLTEWAKEARVSELFGNF